ncbi:MULTISPECIES: IclR family transcriptional regulator [Halopenitus]|uniref:DNA-binding transcriptional regulator, IclR family n=1 Tax=Halopenitus malekzadehii TaxID=1267564 RepID=A0A1H6I7H8_9EURY|nr:MULTISPECIES: IclR family transcriptional regulator [Halopenitus]SEH42674.1 DNA-binding transcriptional regulator, IclR family [Halopenitus malekzadehii]
MTDGNTGTVKSVETMFEVIEVLRKRDGARVTTIAEELGLSKSAVHKHLSTLRNHRFAVQEGDEYRLGLGFFGYGSYVRTRYDVFRKAKPLVRELADETGEMVWLITEENGMGMYLFGDGGSLDVNVDSLVGSWRHLHLNSGGKAILSRLPEDRVADIVDRHGLPRRTEATITDPDALFDELETVRERGYALNLAEDMTGIHAVGVPIIHRDRVRGALSIAGAANRLTEERLHEEYADRLLTAVNDLELNLTYR